MDPSSITRPPASVAPASVTTASAGSTSTASGIEPEQGNCNDVRAAAAAALGDWLNAEPTGVEDDGSLIIGDLNSYDHEDPIVNLEAAGFTDLLGEFQGEDAYTYVFDGMLGYLDYGLADADLVSSVLGAAAWHANTDEPGLIDYTMEFKQDAQDALWAPDAYRASDHDAVVIGLDLAEDDAECGHPVFGDDHPVHGGDHPGRGFCDGDGPGRGHGHSHGDWPRAW